MKVSFGIETLVRERFRRLRGRRVGLIANQTSVDRRMIHLADLLHKAEGVELKALFGPEHGARGDAQDMIGVDFEHDRKTRVPVHSLYGSDVTSLTPSDAQLEGLDALIFDVQDIGSRYYTFAATMAYAMRASASKGLGFVVLDRPNPIGGALVEGPTILPGYESFVGFHPMPIRHGMTVGELALMIQEEWRLDLDLEVVPCEGWTRSMNWRECEAPWISPSPNMPTCETALVYPGGCLIEGTNLSEGRGTTRPFENWGAPGLDADALMKRVSELMTCDGVQLRPNGFRPTFHKHAGDFCQGVQAHVIKHASFRPVALFTAFLAAAHDLVGDAFAWRTEPYEFVANPMAIDLLYGSARERAMIDAGLTTDGLRTLTNEVWKADEREFQERREPHLIYR